MKTKSEQKKLNHPQPVKSQAGNALIYVLIAIALFAALSYTFARQNSNESTDQVTQAKAETFAVQLIGYAAQVKSVIDQMTITGTQINQLDFTQPGDPTFNTGSPVNKIYHPSGGGLTPLTLPKAIAASGLTPPSGVYLGLFNNMEWTPSGANDILLSAYGISKPVCASINKKITGNTEIPVATGELEKYFIDATFHSTNMNLTTAECEACENHLTLCVSDLTAKTFTFYTVIVPR